jgi:hypothetical protein
MSFADKVLGSLFKKQCRWELRAVRAPSSMEWTTLLLDLRSTFIVNSWDIYVPAPCQCGTRFDKNPLFILGNDSRSMRTRFLGIQKISGTRWAQIMSMIIYMNRLPNYSKSLEEVIETEHFRFYFELSNEFYSVVE